MPTAAARDYDCFVFLLSEVCWSKTMFIGLPAFFETDIGTVTEAVATRSSNDDRTQ